MLSLKNTDKAEFNKYLFFILLFLSIVVGKLIASDSYNQLWVLLFPALIFIVWKTNLWTLVLISVIIFFGDWLIIDLHLLSEQFMWLQEFLVLLIFIKAIANNILKKKKTTYVGSWAVLVFLAVSLISLYINKSGFVSFFLFFRLVIKYYFLFIAIVNLNLREDEKKFFNNILLALIIIQVPVAIIKLFIYGQGERAIGTYYSSGGTLSTVLPLIVIGFCLSYFLLYKKSSFFIWLILGFIAFSIIGGKRGFVFFLPLVLVFLSWYLKSYIKNIFRYVLLGGTIFILASFFVLSLVPSLSPGYRERSGFNPLYALSFVTEYTTSQSQGLSWGRASTSINIFQNLFRRGSLKFLFGNGPGSVMKSRFDAFNKKESFMQDFNVGYGTSGLSWIVMNIGYLGAFFYFLLIFLIMRRCVSYYRLEKDPYWRSFGLGMIVFSFVMMLMNILYAPIIIDELVSMHYFCLSGFIILREKGRI